MNTQIRKYFLPIGGGFLSAALCISLFANYTQHKNLTHFTVGMLAGIALVFITFSRLRTSR